MLIYFIIGLLVAAFCVWAATVRGLKPNIFNALIIAVFWPIAVAYILIKVLFSRGS